MPLEAADELLSHASRGRYAVGYFESWDIASLEGVIDAAEQSRAPVIVGFNGEFLARPERDPPARLEWYGALGRAAAESRRSLAPSCSTSVRRSIGWSGPPGSVST